MYDCRNILISLYLNKLFRPDLGQNKKHLHEKTINYFISISIIHSDRC